MDLRYFSLPVLQDAENRLKMCYACMCAKNLFHQEISILNPAPAVYDPKYIFPRDMYLFTHNIDTNGPMVPLGHFLSLAKANNAPVTCIGSHNQNIDRSFMLLYAPFAPEVKSEAGIDPKCLL